jgi:hypothetical protein
MCRLRIEVSEHAADPTKVAAHITPITILAIAIRRKVRGVSLTPWRRF